ncbi:hypothetical protein Nepgr_021798 [Nepenthes gracilis]|uniref:Uncharacterized protein n=1 Tax=Nepenthes gracilis TaxID=150966 RepID=A0AAD3SZI5_NEPGR|nr:hypothetical protein Nepgr_021798 [Nepenthes gracilis]
MILPRGGFNPFGEVVNALNDELPLRSRNGKWAENIEPSMYKRPRSLEGFQLCKWLVVKIFMKLAILTLLHEL